MRTLLLLVFPWLIAGLACQALLPRAAAPTPTPTTVEQVTPAPLTPTADDPPAAEPTSDALDPEILEQMAQIEAQVETLRGLSSINPLKRTLLTPEQLRQRVIDEFLVDYTEQEARDDALVLSLFGLLERDFALLDFYIELYSEGIAGYFDDQEGRMYVVRGAGFEGPERLFYAHEYVHVLQDQRFDLDQGLGFSDETCETDSELCAALSALIEGDATLIEEQWLRTYAGAQDLAELLDYIGSLQLPVFESAPRFIQEDWLFSYDAGYQFVRELYEEGGWAGVDQAYLDPPVSTEQILHPERFPQDVPLVMEGPELAGALGADWREVDRDVLGEWYTRLVLEEFIQGEDAREGAEGWGGDYYLVLEREGSQQSILVLLSAWDTVRDAHEFSAAFRNYADARFGERTLSTTTAAAWAPAEAYVTFSLLGHQTLWIMAPDEGWAARVREALPFPAQQQ